MTRDPDGDVVIMDFASAVEADDEFDALWVRYGVHGLGTVEAAVIERDLTGRIRMARSGRIARPGSRPRMGMTTVLGDAGPPPGVRPDGRDVGASVRDALTFCGDGEAVVVMVGDLRLDPALVADGSPHPRCTFLDTRIRPRRPPTRPVD